MALGPECLPVLGGRSLTQDAARGAIALLSQRLVRDTIDNRENFSFPGSVRLKKRGEFLKVQQTGKKLHTRNLLIVMNKNDLGRNRLGVVVSRKVDKRATVRNKIKRRLREIFRLNLKHFSKHFDIVIIARKNAAECKYHEMERQILGALKKHGYLY